VIQAGAHITYLLATGEGLDWATKLTGIGAMAGAGIALVAALIALGGFLQSRAHARQARAHSYLERYNSDLHIEPRVRLHEFFTIGPDQEDERIAEWQNMTFEDKLLTVQELNFWEELSGMYNRKLLDRGIVDSYFGSEALETWGKIGWFVTYQRTRQCNAMKELERMCKTITERRENLLEGDLRRPKCGGRRLGHIVAS
jgi:hypothetical protein